MAPALPTLTDAFSVSEDRVGLVLSVYTLAAALALPFLGLLLDRVGRKTVGVACLLIDGSFGVACTFAPTFGVLLLLRFFQGIGIAGLIPVAMTVISDIFLERKIRLKLMGILSGTIAASAALVPILGGALASVHWRYPFYVYAFSVFIAAAFAFLIPETKPGGETKAPLREGISEYLAGMKHALRIPRVRETFAHSFVLYFLLYSLVTFLPLFLVQSHGLGTFVAGAALALQATLAVVVASKADWVDDHWGWKTKLIIGFVFMAASLATLPLWPGITGVVASLFAFGVGMGFVQPAVYHEATAAPPKELAGSVVALFNTMKYVGMSASPLVLGMIARYYPTGTLFIAAAGICIGWTVGFPNLFSRRQARRSR